MKDPLVAAASYIVGLFKGNFRKPTITFITTHYLIMIGLTIGGLDHSLPWRPHGVH